MHFCSLERGRSTSIRNESTTGIILCDRTSYCYSEAAATAPGRTKNKINICKLTPYDCFLFSRCRNNGWAGQIHAHSIIIGRYDRAAIKTEALLSYLRKIVDKTSKENLKPRKPGQDEIKFLQCNMQKSHHAQIDLNRRITLMNKGQDRFIVCIQEPCSTKSELISQPNSVQRFGKMVCPRTCIYVDNQTDAWFIEALSSKDITAIQICIRKQDALIAIVYMDGTDSEVWG